MLRRLATITAAVAMAAALTASNSAVAEVVLHRGNGGEPQTLDQAHTSIDVEANILKDLYEGLTVYDVSGNVTPGVAESWSVSDDGLTYTFKLREDAKWSNGDPVTADDFVFSFQRVEDPKEAAGYASILYPIKNAEAINTATADKPMAVDQLGMKAVDPKTLEITLERPTPYFLQLLTHQTALPVNKASVEKFGADFVKPGNMVSNGAFTLVENVANDHITLAKNPNYWGADTVKIDTVIFYPTEDQAAAIRRFQAGELDLQYQFPADQTEFLKSSSALTRSTSPRTLRPITTSSTRGIRRSTTFVCAALCRWRSIATSWLRRSTPGRSCRPTASCRRESLATSSRRPTSPACRSSTVKTKP